jgi:ABC-type sugar transport system ATPase subunit
MYVTHDPLEAVTLGDRIAVLVKGRVEQIGSPDEVCRQPVSEFVADLFDMHEIRGLDRL